MPTKFSISNNHQASNMTSNITHFLSRDDQTVLLADVTPGFMHQIFGSGLHQGFYPGDYEYDSKGYTDPEWYWKASDGKVWGIGWRWGSPRLRGKGSRNGQSFSHPCKFTAFEFVEFLRVSFGR